MKVRNIDTLKVDAVIKQGNARRLDLLRLRAGTVFHADASPTVATADAEDIGGLVALVNALKGSYNAHVASACDAVTGEGAHIAADADNVVSTADATDEASAIALANDLKAKYNLHRASTTVHAAADSTNSVTAANADDLAKAITLANQIKAKLNAHYAGAFAHKAIRVIAP